jgi:hypothetical protein
MTITMKRSNITIISPWVTPESDRLTYKWDFVITPTDNKQFYKKFLQIPQDVRIVSSVRTHGRRILKLAGIRPHIIDGFCYLVLHMTTPQLRGLYRHLALMNNRQKLHAFNITPHTNNFKRSDIIHFILGVMIQCQEKYHAYIFINILLSYVHPSHYTTPPRRERPCKASPTF